MGANNICLELNGKRTVKEVEEAFREQKKLDAEVNGHQDGYSGDFQTISRVECHFEKVFANINVASEYCLEKSEKWDKAIAVHYVKYFKYSKKVASINKKIDALNRKIIHTEQKNIEKMKKKSHITCKKCKSRLNTAYIGISCKVCGEILINLNRVDALNKKIDELRAKNAQQKKLEEKNVKPTSKNVDTLIGGWGAC